MSVFKDKTLLITGGTGSFGNAVLNRFLRTDIGEIRIFSRDEKKQDDMRHDFQARMPEVAGKIKFYIGDVRNKSTLKYAMKGVDYVFHAAALKQVPSCEFFPMEAVKTNVIGTDNTLDAAIDAGVKCVICLSTDKAAYPINAMGITKGQHWHNTKFEQFIVVKGHGLIQQRNLNDPEGKVLEWEVDGDHIQAVHMLPGYTHNIINLSDTEDLVTVMYCNEVFNPDKPDTFFEPVK